MKQSRAIDCSLSRGFALLAGIPEKDTAEKPVDKNYKGVCFLNGVLHHIREKPDAPKRVFGFLAF